MVSSESSDDVYLTINVESLIEYDINDDEIMLNTFTSFRETDWINQSIFEPLLSNGAKFKFILSVIPQHNELEYNININNWPWYNEQDIIKFCFSLNGINIDNIDQSNEPSVQIIEHENEYYLCSILDYIDEEEENQEISQFGHIYYQNVVNHFTTTSSFYPTSNKSSYSDHGNNKRSVATQRISVRRKDDFQHSDEYHNHKHSISFNASTYSYNRSNISLTSIFSMNDDEHDKYSYLYGVIIVIGSILCLFVLLMIYFIREGLFDEAKIKKKPSKRHLSLYDKTSRSMHNNFDSTSNLHGIKKIDKQFKPTTDLPTIPVNPIKPIQPLQPLQPLQSLTSIDVNEIDVIHENIQETPAETEHDRDIDDISTLCVISSTTQMSPTETIISSNGAEFEEAMISYIIKCSHNEHLKNSLPFI